MEKSIPVWMEPVLTPENLMKAVQACLFDGATCENCPFVAWEYCADIVIENLAKRMGVSITIW